MININHHVIRQTIEELNGLQFNNSKPYSCKARIFFEDRYKQILKSLPQVSEKAVGLEVGLAGGVLALLLKRVLRLKLLYSLEHPVATKAYTKKFLEKVETNNIILKPVDLRKFPYPWKDNFFDFIIFSEVMEHLIPSDIPDVIKELKRILRKGGILIITTPNISSLLKRVNLVLGKNPIEFDLKLHEGATFGHIREYTMEETVSILRMQDLKTIKFQYFSIDKNRNIFTRIEYAASTLIPSLGNNIMVIAKKNASPTP